MAEEGGMYATINYYKEKITNKFSRPADYTEMNENNELFFGNPVQRKEESLRHLKEWAKEVMDRFDKLREIVEQLANSVDFGVRQSVDYLQIVYKFLNERYYQEQQYAQFLLIKPQVAMKNNVQSNRIYGCITTAIAQFEEDNLKRAEKIAIFAHELQSKVLKGEAFTEFAELDKKSDILLNSIIIQKKLLQQYVAASASKLNKVIPLVSRQKKRGIFDEPEQQEKKFTDRVLTNMATMGSVLVGQTINNVDPIEAELNKQLEEQERKHKEQLQLQEKLELQSIEGGTEQKQPIEELHSKVEAKEIEPQQFAQAQCSQEVQEIQEVKEIKEVQEIKEIKEIKEVTDQVEKQQTRQLSNAELYKQQQIQGIKQDQAKTKQYQSEKEDLPYLASVHQNQDLYRIMISYIITQQYATKMLHSLADKVIQYWKHVQIVEEKRSNWAKNACQVYKEGIVQAHGADIHLPVMELDAGHYYKLETLFQDELNEETLMKLLNASDMSCSAAKILLVKEFRVTVIDKQNKEWPGYLVLTIDKYVGCWVKNEDIYENIDQPVFHLSLKDIVLNKLTNLMVEVMPQAHVLFLNIANDRQKSKIKFHSSDDLEEFCTIVS